MNAATGARGPGALPLKRKEDASLHEVAGDPDAAAARTQGEAAVAFTPRDWAGAGFFRPYEPLARP